MSLLFSFADHSRARGLTLYPSISGAFQILQLPTLRKLNLADNLFKTVPPELVNAHELEELNLSNNRFKTLPANAFHGLTSLTRLDLNNQFHLTRWEGKIFDV